MLDTIKLESMGIPTAALAYDTFEQAARQQAEIAKMPPFPIVVIQHWEPDFTAEDARKEADKLGDLILSKLIK